MISIIIPVFNVENYLRQCLQSVIEQTFTDWECILVDDGSKDRSGVICDEFAKMDSRFAAIHQENRGVSAARNKGLQVAKGEYICFIDSDDWVKKTYLSDMLAGMEDKAVDMVVTGLSKIYPNRSSMSFSPPQRCIIKANDQYTKTFIDNVGLFYGPTSILYKTSIIRYNNLSFPVDFSFGEDTIFNFRYLNHVNDILLLPVINYFYRTNKGTLSSSMHDLPFTRYSIWKKRLSFYKSKNMWDSNIKENMYKELWAIVYDGIFSSSNHTFSHIKKILSFEEISDLKKWYHVYVAPFWIKKMIIHRASLVFYIYLYFIK